MKQYFLIAIIISVTLGACKKDTTEPSPGTKLKIALTHTVGNSPLQFDTLMYQNKAGEIYSVNNLVYFLSNISFYKQGKLVFAADTVIYVDAKVSSQPINISGATAFTYDSVAYYIGVPPASNVHDKLAPTFENKAMEWPDVMGGGYHFLKLEGHWKDAGSATGYAMHLGTDPYLVKGGHKFTGQVIANRENALTFSMDVNEWFEAPNTYSFENDGVYTMGNAALMQKISDNGKDVFQVKF